MKPYHRRANLNDTLRLIQNLREEDKHEMEGLGHTPLALFWCVEVSEYPTAFFNEDGELAGIVGIGPDSRKGVGQIWMVCTPAVQKNPHTFVRYAKRWLNTVSKNYQMLWNQVDSRNELHLKFIKLLGFKSLRIVCPPPYYLPYIEIVKLCAYPSQQVLESGWQPKLLDL